MPGPGRNPATDPTLSTPPCRRSIMPGRNNPVSSVSAVILTWIISSCRRSGNPANEPCAPNPALLTRTSTAIPLPCSSLNTRAGVSGRERSAVNTSVSILCVRRNSVGQRLQRLGVAGEQYQPASVGGETFRQFQSDARRSAGDQDRFAVHGVHPVRGAIIDCPIRSDW